MFYKIIKLLCYRIEILAYTLCAYHCHWQMYLLKKINFKRGKIRLWDKICYLCYISDPILALPNTCISLNIQQHGPQHSTTLNSTHKTQLTTTSWIRTFRAGTPRSHTNIYLVLHACIYASLNWISVSEEWLECLLQI